MEIKVRILDKYNQRVLTTYCVQHWNYIEALTRKSLSTRLYEFSNTNIAINGVNDMIYTIKETIDPTTALDIEAAIKNL